MSQCETEIPVYDPIKVQIAFWKAGKTKKAFARNVMKCSPVWASQVLNNHVVPPDPEMWAEKLTMFLGNIPLSSITRN